MGPDGFLSNNCIVLRWCSGHWRSACTPQQPWLTAVTTEGPGPTWAAIAAAAADGHAVVFAWFCTGARDIGDQHAEPNSHGQRHRQLRVNVRLMCRGPTWAVNAAAAADGHAVTSSAHQ